MVKTLYEEILVEHFSNLAKTSIYKLKLYKAQTEYKENYFYFYFYYGQTAENRRERENPEGSQTRTVHSSHHRPRDFTALTTAQKTAKQTVMCPFCLGPHLDQTA